MWYTLKDFHMDVIHVFKLCRNLFSTYQGIQKGINILHLLEEGVNH
jgi:hypothetical protein